MVVTTAIPSQRLLDNQGRHIRKLRLSVTDRCNLRCTYCMPVDAAFMPPQTYLSPTEYATIVAELVALGIESVRLTGVNRSCEPSLLRLSQPWWQWGYQS